MKKDFQYALTHNQLLPFFNGEDDYFSPHEMSWGRHFHTLNWSAMVSYLKCQPNPFQTLVTVFKSYLSLLDEQNIHHVWALFNNIGCFYSDKKYTLKFLNPDDDLIDELTPAERHKIGRSYRFLRENFELVPGAQDMMSLQRQFEFTKKQGCSHNLFSY